MYNISKHIRDINSIEIIQKFNSGKSLLNTFLDKQADLLLIDVEIEEPDHIRVIDQEVEQSFNPGIAITANC